jgi:hypothetical protein
MQPRERPLDGLGVLVPQKTIGHPTVERIQDRLGYTRVDRDNDFGGERSKECKHGGRLRGGVIGHTTHGKRVPARLHPGDYNDRRN